MAFKVFVWRHWCAVIPCEHPVGVKISLETSSTKLDGQLPVPLLHGLRHGLRLPDWRKQIKICYFLKTVKMLISCHLFIIITEGISLISEIKLKLVFELELIIFPNTTLNVNHLKRVGFEQNRRHGLEKILHSRFEPTTFYLRAENVYTGILIWRLNS